MPEPNQTPAGRDQRPEFMVALGVMPPYSLEDIKQAYLAKVHRAHPDHGGSIDHFRVIQESYKQAQAYVQFRSNKRAWIAAQMERYTAQEDVEERLRGYGGKMVFAKTDWLQKSYGDFAELSTSVDEIELVNSKSGPEVLKMIVAQQQALSGLKRLILRQCHLRDDDVMPLSCFQVLGHLDLSGNLVTHRVLELAKAIPTLKSMSVGQTSVGWASRAKLALVLRRRQQTVVSPLKT